MNNSWLLSTNPIFDANVEVWEKNERRMLGGHHIRDELIRFDWEIEKGEHYRGRQNQITWLPFPDRYASQIVGHMMREAPIPGGALDFGTLGEVRRMRDLNNPTPAELVYYNVDGVGNDGSQWNNWWTCVGKMACATGHRWILVEGPQEAPQNRFQEINEGLRPILQDYSPRSVPNWGYTRGRLDFAIIRRQRRHPRLENGVLTGNKPENEFLLVTRAGFQDFGPEYASGGWFIFDANGDIQDFGDYAATGGDIPMFPLFYERMKSEEGFEAMSRPGTTEMGNAAIAYMNLASAADFDAFDSASSVQALKNVDEEGFNLFVRKVKAGNRYAPLKPARDFPNQSPDIKDASVGQIVADVFDRRLRAKRDEAREMLLGEMRVSADASGTAREASWGDVREPRLALFASEYENGQNSAIHYLERMWSNGGPATGSVAWKRQFALIDPSAAAQDFFTVENLSGYHSQTLGARVMTEMAKAKGFLTSNEDEATIENEYKAAARQAQVRQRRLDATIGKSPQPAAPTPATAPGQQTTPDAGNANPNKPPKKAPKQSAVAG